MLDWFTTIPGILISCGAILLIVAIILFILGNKKEKRMGNLAMNTGVMNQPLVSDEVVTKDAASMIIDEAKPIAMEGVNPSNPAIIDFTPSVPAEEEPVASVSEETSSSEVPTMEPLEDGIKPAVEPVNTFNFSIPEPVPTYEEPKPVEPVIEPAVASAPVAPVSEETSSYDFSVPTMEPVVEEPKPVEPVNTFNYSAPTPEVAPVTPEVKIYGGNDPLENTMVTETINHVPYGGVPTTPVESVPTYEEPKPVEPVIEPVVASAPAAPVSEETSSYDFSIPTMEPVVEEPKPVEPVNTFNYSAPTPEVAPVTPVISEPTPVVPEPVQPVGEVRIDPVSTISIPEIQPMTDNKEEL